MKTWIEFEVVLESNSHRNIIIRCLEKLLRCVFKDTEIDGKQGAQAYQLGMTLFLEDFALGSDLSLYVLRGSNQIQFLSRLLSYEYNDLAKNDIGDSVACMLNLIVVGGDSWRASTEADRINIPLLSFQKYGRPQTDIRSAPDKLA